jgi:MFS family permease
MTYSGQAIPQITDEFNSLADVGWYGSAYLLTCCAFQLLFGKFYTLYSVKGVFLTSILLFEVASALCGAASSSIAFIVGRAISGVGAAGIFAGTVSLLLFPLLSALTVTGVPRLCALSTLFLCKGVHKYKASSAPFLVLLRSWAP